MKHRSIHIFILVAAILVAAPRASQELSAMKDSLGQRLKAEIFNVFLSLHTGDATRPAQPADDSLLASDGEARGAKRAGGPARAATQVEVHARREVPAEVAAITEPVVEIAELEPARLEAPGLRFELHDPKVIRGRELSMIIPPDADITAPPPPRPARRETARRVPALSRRAAELSRRAAVNVDFEGAVEIQGLATEELHRQLNDIQQYRFDANGAHPRTKVLKVKRAAPRPAPAPPSPAARALCPKTSPSPAPTRQVACGPSPVETFYAGE